MLRRLALLSVFVFASVAAFAADKQPPMPKPLADQAARGAQVYYLGKYDTLDSWAMIRTGQPEFYYATPGNKALVMGLLFGENGDLMTGEQLKTLQTSQQAAIGEMMASQLPQVPDDNSMANLPAPDAAAAAPETPQTSRSATAPAAPAPATTPPAQTAPATPPAAAPTATQPAGTTLNTVANTLIPATPAARLLGDMQMANGVIWGQAGSPMFYALVDPNCPHCQHFLQQAEPFVNAGLIAVRIIPIGFDDKSRQQAALVLAVGDGPARMLAYAKGDTTQLNPPADINVAGVTANTVMFDKWHLEATPIIIYQAGGKTGPVKLIRGRPLDMAAAVADLRGAEAQSPQK